MAVHGVCPRARKWRAPKRGSPSHLSHPQERQADWLLRAYGPSGAVPVPVLLDYLRAELSTTAEAADSPVDATLGFSVPQPLHLHAQAQLSQQQQPPPDDGMDAVPVVDVAAGQAPSAVARRAEGRWRRWRVWGLD